MSKNPFFNAAGAAVYVVGIVLLINYLSNNFIDQPDSETLLAPMAMLMLFVLSAAVMGYLFVITPLRLYLDGAKEEAVSFFLKTVGIFAVITLLAFILLISTV